MNKFEFLKDDLYLHYPINHCVKMNTDELNTSRKEEIDWWDTLTKSEITEITEIMQGLKDVENGETISSKDFWNQFENNNT